MKYQFSSRFDDIQPSGIRAVLDQIPADKIINFSPGFPDKNAFPSKAIERISSELLKTRSNELLQYARRVIHPELKEELVKFVNRDEIIYQDNDDITVTSGSGEGIEMACKVFMDQGETMLVEDPTFIGAINGFKTNQVNILPVTMDNDGINIDSLKSQLVHKPRMLYTIPTFQNPTGITTNLEKRKQIYDICVKHNIIILEDNPYGALRFEGENVPTYKSMDSEGIVVYLASLSKIISPGMRLGMVVANNEVIQHFNTLKQASGGAATNWSQLVIKEFLVQEDIDQHLKHIKEVYSSKSNHMYKMMKKYFHPSVTINKPQGGMFIWFTLPDNVDAKAFQKAATENYVAIVYEDTFAINQDRKLSGFRLSFTSESLETIEKGIQILGDLTNQYCKGE